MKRYDEMLPRAWDLFEPGARVITTGPILDFPMKLLPSGMTGTVLYSSDDVGIAVRLDAHVPELDDWDNTAHIGMDVRANEDRGIGRPPIRIMTPDEKSVWSIPGEDVTKVGGVDLRVVSDRIFMMMLAVGTQAGKVQEMASHFRALGFNGPYDQLYLIASYLEDITEELNTTRLGYVGAFDEEK